VRYHTGGRLGAGTSQRSKRDVMFVVLEDVWKNKRLFLGDVSRRLLRLKWSDWKEMIMQTVEGDI